MILGIDQGTTGSTCLVFDADGRPRGRAYSEFRQHFPRRGWVEHDPREIWEVTRRVAHEALADAGIGGSDLAGIGITNQREPRLRGTASRASRCTVRSCGRTGARAAAATSCGRRAASRCSVSARGSCSTRTSPAPSTSGCCATAASTPARRWGRSTPGSSSSSPASHVTDYSNAARTLLFNIRELRWDEELCALLGVPVGSLPEAVCNAVVYGETTEFGGRVPVCGMAGDQQAALYGQGCHSPGLGKNTCGTGNFLLQHAGAGSPLLEQGLITTIAWGIGGRVDYALESSMFVTGAGVQWLRDGLGIIEQAADTEALAASLDAHIARATLEAIAYQTVDAVRAQNTALGIALKELRADGGATANGWLMQFQADVLGVPVVVPEVSETTVHGAAYLAGVTAGCWTEADTRAAAGAVAPRAGARARLGGARRLEWTRSLSKRISDETDPPRTERRIRKGTHGRSARGLRRDRRRGDRL